MLGLGKSLIFENTVKRLIFEYNSDFSSDADGWYKYVVTTGDITLTANETIGGEDHWLKIEFDEDQPGHSGLQKDLGWSAREGAVGMEGTKKGDIAEISFKIYLLETGSDHWDGTDDVSYSSQAIGIGGFVQNPGGSAIPQNTNYTISHKNISTFNTSDGCGDYSPCSYNDDVRLLFLYSGDKPSAGAIFYIKDYNIKIYR